MCSPFVSIFMNNEEMWAYQKIYSWLNFFFEFVHFWVANKKTVTIIVQFLIYDSDSIKYICLKQRLEKPRIYNEGIGIFSNAICNYFYLLDIIIWMAYVYER